MLYDLCLRRTWGGEVIRRYMLTFLQPLHNSFPEFDLGFACHVDDLAAEQTGVIHAYMVSEDFLFDVIPTQEINVEHLTRTSSVRIYDKTSSTNHLGDSVMDVGFVQKIVDR